MDPLPCRQSKNEAYSFFLNGFNPEQDGLVPGWRDQNGFTFPILVGAKTDTLIEEYRLSSTPLNFLLDADGKIISRQEGYAPGAEARIEAQIRQSLGLE